MWGSSITFEDYPLEQAVKVMADLGFTRVEMWKHHLLRCKTPELRQMFAEFAASSGIMMGGLNVVGEDYYRPFGTEEEFGQTLRGLKNDVDYALSLGTTDALIWEGVRPVGFDEAWCKERLLPRLIELFRQAIAYANPKGVRFLVEPHPFTVGMSDSFLIELYDSLPSGSFGITYDFCHYGVGRPHDYVQAVRNLGQRIRHIHLADSDLLSSELHFAPGEGRMDINALVDVFKEINYNGTLTLDLYGNPTPIRAAQFCAPAVKEICETLGCTVD
jgi:sugar phosphate isomerase/epimerase